MIRILILAAFILPISMSGQVVNPSTGGGVPTGPCGGDLSGTFPNCTVATVKNGLTPATTSTLTNLNVAMATGAGSIGNTPVGVGNLDELADFGTTNPTANPIQSGMNIGGLAYGSGFAMGGAVFLDSGTYKVAYYTSTAMNGQYYGCFYPSGTPPTAFTGLTCPIFAPSNGGAVQFPNSLTTTTQAVNNNSTNAATTAFVVGQAGTATPIIDGTGTVGTSLLYSRQDHVHPTDTTRAPLASPTFTGTAGFTGSVTVPNVGINNSGTFAANTAFVTRIAGILNANTSATGGTGISAVSCSTAACTNLSGTYTMTATTVSAGTILTLVWPTTTTAYNCFVTQDGGAVALGLGHSVATATGMTISVAVSVASGSITLDYGCHI